MPRFPRTFHTQFIFSLAAILADLEPDVAKVKQSLTEHGQVVNEELIVTAWVSYQLERHLYLSFAAEGQRVDILRLTHLIDQRFFHNNDTARTLLLSQVRPVLTHRETVPYTDRICRVEARLPDMHLHFL